MQRPGTSLLNSALSQNPCINMGYELFRPGEGVAEFWDDTKIRKAVQLYFNNLNGELSLQRPEDIELFHSAPEYFQHAIRNVNISRLVRGFDWIVDGRFFDAWSWFPKFCGQHDVKILWLHSRHLLRHYVSVNAFEKTHTAGHQPRKKIKLSVEDMLRTIENWANLNAQMKNLLQGAQLAGVPTLSVDYEDLVSTPQILDTVEAFAVNDSACKVRTKHRRIAHEQIIKGPIRRMIKNWAEVYAALIETRFAWLLTD